MTPTINVAVQTATNSGNSIQSPSFSGENQGSDGKTQGDSFSALFKHLLEKSTPPDGITQLIDLETEINENPGSEVTENALNSLLPFLEAIGLTHEANVEQNPATEMAVPELPQLSDPLATIAAPITPQVIATANIAAGYSTLTPAAVSNDGSLVVSPALVDLQASNQSHLIESGIDRAGKLPVPVDPQASNTRSSLVGSGIDQTWKTPTQSDQLTSDKTLSPPTDRFADQLDMVIDRQTSQATTAVAADTNKSRPQENSLTSTPLIYHSPGNQATQNVEHPSKLINIPQPVGTVGWDKELGQHIIWMAQRSEGKAELVLTPPQMGRVEVSLTVSGDQATASFASANPVVREALESALPRLREALAEAGIQLGQAQVGSENAHQTAQQEKNPDKLATHTETSAEKSSIITSSGHDSATKTLKLGRGLVDVFA